MWLQTEADHPGDAVGILDGFELVAVESDEEVGREEGALLELAAVAAGFLFDFREEDFVPGAGQAGVDPRFIERFRLDQVPLRVQALASCGNRHRGDPNARGMRVLLEWGVRRILYG